MGLRVFILPWPKAILRRHIPSGATVMAAPLGECLKARDEVFQDSDETVTTSQDVGLIAVEPGYQVAAGGL